MSIIFEEILSLAEKMPTGLPDGKAPEKLLAEYKEFLLATSFEKKVEEAVDVYYYAIKSIHLVISEIGIDFEQLHKAALAKLNLRSAIGNPKNKIEERKAMMKAMGLIYV